MKEPEKSNTNFRAVFRVVVVFISGVAFDMTVTSGYLHFLVPHLPKVWLGILLYFTWEIAVSSWCKKKLDPVGVHLRGKPLLVLMAVLSIGYWYGIRWFFSMRPPISSNLDADLEFVFYGHDTLKFTLTNNSNSASGRAPWVFFGLLDVSNPFRFAPSPQHDPRFMPTLPIPSTIIQTEYARPGKNTGRYEVFDPISKAHVKNGDRIWGFGTLTCENCIKERRYYIYWVKGEGGWYVELPESAKLKLPSFSPSRPIPDAELLPLVERSLSFDAEKRPISKDLPVPP